MSRAALILPYFGRFPNYFPLFLKSFGLHPSFDLLIFTDDHAQYDYPANVKTHFTTFAETADLFRSRISPDICLSDVHKLCEYKPTYGYVYSDYIQEYEYWGYCDCDVIMGDLSAFVLPLFDAHYDKIFALGHLSFIRNTPENNGLFMSVLNGERIYEQALFHPETYWLDESFKPDRKDINTLFAAYGKKVFFQDYSLNPKIETLYFHQLVFNFSTYIYNQVSEFPFYVVWSAGHIFKVCAAGLFGTKKTEYCYLHLQRRKMSYDSSILNEDSFRIVPDQFLRNAKYSRPNIFNTTSLAGLNHYLRFCYAMMIRWIRSHRK